MALATLFTAAIVLAAAPTISGPADWVVHARAGQLACLLPNVTKKTCGSLARYTWTKDGKVVESAETLLALEPPLTFRTRKVYAMRSGDVCGIITEKDVDGAVILSGGRPAPRRTAEQARELLHGELLDFLDREICMSFVPRGSSFEARVSVNGLIYTHLSETVIWVRPNDGYAVKP